MKGSVLIIAGSDSGGGAGIQADIKTVTALGGYAMTALTALTAQNSKGVHAIHDVPPEFVARQIEVVIDDFGVDAVKIGMLHRVDTIKAVADIIEARLSDVPLVLDPVMVAKGGAPLLETEAVAALKRWILPFVNIMTPNIPEAASMAGYEIRDLTDAEAAGRALVTLGSWSVLVKGGHLQGERVVDLLFEEGELTKRFESDRIDTENTHGTGCTLASAIATGLAQGMELRDAVARARAYVFEAIRTNPGLGHGHGPLNHGHTVKPFPG